jgi:hypothetical protein
VTLDHFPILLAGTIVADRYRVEGPLGSGGFGTVVRATQLPLGREVAIKVMVSPLGDGARFVREAQTAQKLEHPNTVRILDFGRLDSGLPFIVFELLRGESLAQLIARTGGLPLWGTLRVTMQVLKSLMEAHAHGIIHRDIKPANLFVTAHPGEPLFVKVLDFGVAKQLGGPDPDGRIFATAPTAPGLTRADQIIGTPLYMSPEQARGAEVGPASDLYALGLVLVEMMTGRPVLDPRLGSMAIALMHDSPRSLPLPQAIYGSPVERLVRRATAKDVRERYRSAQEMLAEVELLLAGTTPAMTVRSAIGDPGTGAATGFAPTAIAMYTPGLSAPHAMKGLVGPARGVWLVLAGGVLAMVLVGASIALWHFSKTKSKRPSSTDDETVEGFTLDAPEARALDPSTRELTERSLEEMIAVLEGEDYSAEEIIKGRTDIDLFSQRMIKIQKAPCGGVATYTIFQNKDAQRTHVDAMKKELLVETGNRVLSVHLTSAGDDPNNRKNCSTPVFALLTRPKKKR